MPNDTQTGGGFSNVTGGIVHAFDKITAFFSEHFGTAIAILSPLISQAVEAVKANALPDISNAVKAVQAANDAGVKDADLVKVAFDSVVADATAQGKVIAHGLATGLAGAAISQVLGTLTVVPVDAEKLNQ